MKDQVHIGIAEDHQLVREGLISMLSTEESIHIVFDVNNGKELIEKIAEHKPHLVLMDIEMPVMSGREALRIIRQRHSKVKVIVLSSHYQEPIILDFIKMGASAFLPKDCSRAKLVETIQSVYKEGHYYDKEISLIMAKELARNNQSVESIKFSEVELSIITMICQGKINKEMADALHLSTRTVEWHRLNIMNAINSKDVSELILYAVRNKLVNVV